MGTQSGRFARVTVGKSGGTEKLVAEMGEFSIDLSADSVDTSSFGDGWGKSDVGIKKWSGSMSGHADAEDATGQGVLESAFDTGALVPDLRFYTKWSTTSGEKVVYYAPDTDSDADAGARINSINTRVDKSGVASISFSFGGSGPLKKFTETLS